MFYCLFKKYFNLFIFLLEFEVNISVVFEDNHLVSENFPIQLTRF